MLHSAIFPSAIYFIFIFILLLASCFWALQILEFLMVLGVIIPVFLLEGFF